jgi:hypothetical protein
VRLNFMLTLEVLPIADWVADLVEWVSVHGSYSSRFGLTFLGTTFVIEYLNFRVEQV